MRRAARAALITVVLAGGGHQTQAASPTPAEWLREACADGELYYLFGACAGYLRSAMDRALELGRAVCPAGDADLTMELGAVVADGVGMLDPVPEETAGSLARRALEAAYPCGQ